MSGPAEVHAGGCLCGGVRYRVLGPLRDVVACHCTQCRRSSGHYMADTSAAVADIVFDAQATLTWYASSADAQRGFCSRCGANLFWRDESRAARELSISAGSLDGPTGLRIARHIFVADKGDYYTLDDGVPQTAAW